MSGRYKKTPSATADAAARTAVESHISVGWGKPSYVMHTPVPANNRHIDVHIISPRQNDPNYTIFTTGMSERPMSAPDGQPAYAELMMHIAGDWDTRPLWEIPYDDPAYWPIAVLKFLACFPEENNTWLGHGHTVPNGNPPQLIDDGSNYVCSLIIDPPNAADGFGQVKTADGRLIQIYAMIPITLEEMNLCISQGENVALDALVKAGYGYVVPRVRPSAV